MSTSPAKGTALVTGASRGIGAVYADRLAKRGYDLILVARNADQLAEHAARLASETGRSVTPLPADLNDETDLAKVEARLREDQTITMLVNNAGVSALAPLLDSDVEKMDDLIAVNITALTRLTYAAAPAFAERGAGTIVNIASTVGIYNPSLNGVYAASKAFVVAFSDSLRSELTDRGVRVQTVVPGATATDFWELGGLHWENLPPEIVMTPEDLVDAALVGLDHGETVTIPGLHDADAWTQLEEARNAIGPLFGNSTPAARYELKTPAAA